MVIYSEVNWSKDKFVLMPVVGTKQPPLMLFTRNILEPTRWQYYFIKVNKLMKCLVFQNKYRKLLTVAAKLMVLDECGKQERGGNYLFDKSCTCSSSHAMWCGIFPFPTFSIYKRGKHHKDTFFNMALSSLGAVQSSRHSCLYHNMMDPKYWSFVRSSWL